MALTLALMPKDTRNSYFEAAKAGAEESARTLGASLVWEGPPDENPGRRREIVDSWITRRVDAIAVSASSCTAMSSALRRARAAGIRTLTWDADCEKDAREFFVSPATSDAVAQTLTFEIVRVLRGKGEIALLTSSGQATNQAEWERKLTERLQREQQDIRVIAVASCHESQSEATTVAAALLGKHPRLTAIVGLCSPAVPGAAQAVKAAGRREVKVLGLATPSAARAYVHDGWVESIVMWNAVDLGYLTLAAAHGLVTGTLASGSSLLEAGRLGKLLVLGDEVRLGRPHIFTKTNIDQHSF